MPKNNKAKIYAEALAQIILQDKKFSAKMAENFAKLLAKAGLLAQKDRVLAMAQDIVLKERGNKKIIFETARPLTSKQKEMLKKIAKDGDIIKEKISPELVAGVRISIDGEKQLDSSLKSKLEKIF